MSSQENIAGCPHDLAEREAACADGYCPICPCATSERSSVIREIVGKLLALAEASDGDKAKALVFAADLFNREADVPSESEKAREAVIEAAGHTLHFLKSPASKVKNHPALEIETDRLAKALAALGDA